METSAVGKRIKSSVSPNQSEISRRKDSPKSIQKFKKNCAKTGQSVASVASNS